MPVVPLVPPGAALNPATPSKSSQKPGAKITVDPKEILLADVLTRIARTEPALFKLLSDALHGKLDEESTRFLNTPPTVVQVAQGRAQVAYELLQTLDNHEAITTHYRK